MANNREIAGMNDIWYTISYIQFIWYTILSSIWYKVSCGVFKKLLLTYQSYISHFNNLNFSWTPILFSDRNGKKTFLINGLFIKKLK